MKVKNMKKVIKRLKSMDKHVSPEDSHYLSIAITIVQDLIYKKEDKKEEQQ